MSIRFKDEQYAEALVRQFRDGLFDENDFSVDEPPQVSNGDGDGAYVAIWYWVSDEQMADLGFEQVRPQPGATEDPHDIYTKRRVAATADETRRLFALYPDEPIMYCSECGGYVTLAEDIGGTQVCCNEGVPDADGHMGDAHDLYNDEAAYNDANKAS